MNRSIVAIVLLSLLGWTVIAEEPIYPDLSSIEIPELQVPDPTAVGSPVENPGKEYTIQTRVTYSLGLDSGSVSKLEIFNSGWQFVESRTKFKYGTLFDFDFEARVDSRYLGEREIALAMDQAFISVSPSSWLTISAGKQQPKWGNYKFFSALTTLDPRILSLGDSQISSGRFGIMMILVPNTYWSLTGLIFPDADFRWSSAGLKTDFALGDLDVSFGAIKNSSIAPTVNGGLLNLGRNDDVAVFGTFAWVPDWYGITADIQWKSSRERSYYFVTSASDKSINLFRSLTGLPPIGATIGLQLVFDSWEIERRITSSFEYYYNGDGLTLKEFDQLKSDISAAGAGNFRGISSFGFGELRNDYLAWTFGGLPIGRDADLTLVGLLDVDSLYGQLSTRLQIQLSHGTQFALEGIINGELGGTNSSSESLMGSARTSTELIASISVGF